MTVKRTERGWPGHYVCASHCLFRRNTLLQKDDINIMVSSIGNMSIGPNSIGLECIGANRIYETMVFVATKQGPYWDADVTRQISLGLNWGISPDNIPDDVDNRANEIHEAHVDEIIRLMENGEIVEYIPEEETYEEE